MGPAEAGFGVKFNPPAPAGPQTNPPLPRPEARCALQGLQEQPRSTSGGK